MIKIVDKPINYQEVVGHVSDGGAGAVNLFLGTVRNKTKNRSVVHLEYESYDQMALSEMNKIVDSAKAKWMDLTVAIVHRVGHLEIGDIAVAIAVSTPHREESFAACKYIIDTLKKTVPIWKKEVFTDGNEWVSAHP
jgi:molybdopterin synthase catalytic subunit